MRLRSSEGVTGVREPISEVAHWYGCGQGALDHHHVDFSTRLPEQPNNMAASCLQSKGSQ